MYSRSKTQKVDSTHTDLLVLAGSSRNLVRQNPTRNIDRGVFTSAADLPRKIRKIHLGFRQVSRTIPLSLRRPQATDHGSRINETAHYWKSIRSQVGTHSHSGRAPPPFVMTEFIPMRKLVSNE